MFLAAALYAGLCGENLSPNIWQLFGNKEANDFSAAELIYEPAPLLFEKVWDSRQQDYHIQIPPRLLLFLKGILLETHYIPGMYWYCRSEEPLPSLGTSVRLYPQMEKCLTNIPDKKLLYLRGKKGSGRKLNFAHLAAQQHMGLAVIPYETLQSEQQLREMRRECLLCHAMFVIELDGETEDLSPLFDWLEDEETIFTAGFWKEIPPGSCTRRQYLPFTISTSKVLADKKLFDDLSLSYQWEQEEERLDFLGRYNFLPVELPAVVDKYIGETEKNSAASLAKQKKAWQSSFLTRRTYYLPNEPKSRNPMTNTAIWKLLSCCRKWKNMKESASLPPITCRILTAHSAAAEQKTQS